MLFDCSTKVYAARLLSPEFGTTVHCTILANDVEEAKELAKVNFDNYCNALFKHHKQTFKYGEININ